MTVSRPVIEKWSDATALACTLLLPLMLMYGRAIAEILIAIIDVIFLLRCAGGRGWSWLRAPWLIIGLIWWGWLIICSLPGIGAGGVPSLLQALAVIRYLLLTVALEHLVLRDPRPRGWLMAALSASAIWIGVNAWLQFITGHNIAGAPRWMDGELTGPFEKPRAGAPMSRLIFPAMLPLISHGRLVAAGAAILAVATVVLIGQRMPLLLTVLGLVVAGALLPRLRAVVLAALLGGAMLLAASAVISPPSFKRLVTKFTTQMEHFGESPYGLLAGRAIVMAEASPITGRGFYGFRTGCDNPAFYRGFTWEGVHAQDGGGTEGCNIHPHNHYMEALTDAGLPGLALFSAMIFALLAALLRHFDGDPTRIGLFVAVFIAEWPLASTSSFFAMDTGGWMFLFAGAGLAYARAASVKTASISPKLSTPTT